MCLFLKLQARIDLSPRYLVCMQISSVMKTFSILKTARNLEQGNAANDKRKEHMDCQNEIQVTENMQDLNVNKNTKGTKSKDRVMPQG